MFKCAVVSFVVHIENRNGVTYKTVSGWDYKFLFSHMAIIILICNNNVIYLLYSTLKLINC